MHHSVIIRTATIAIAMFVAAGYGYAADTKSAAPGSTAASARASEKSATDKTPAAMTNKNAVAPAKLVDINSASKAELTKLPGINDVVADKIIAGRPFNTKARLVTDKILSTDAYANIKQLIIAKQK